MCSISPSAENSFAIGELIILQTETCVSWRTSRPPWLPLREVQTQRTCCTVLLALKRRQRIPHSTRTSLTPCKLRTRQCKCRRLIIKHNFHLQNAKKSTCWPPALGNQGHANGGSSHYACISHAQAMLVNTAGGLGSWWQLVLCIFVPLAVY